MKLIEFKIKAKTKAEPGWNSQALLFGDRVTQLYGPNGSGKTPIILSIVYALGYQVTFRDDIYQQCDSVQLTVQSNNRTLTLSRNFHPSIFHVTVHEEGLDEKEFVSDFVYSDFIFEKLGLSSPALLTTQNKPTKAYISTLLPLVYLDQDEGYASFYKAPVTFIKDQFAEMLRILFNLPPANSFNREKEYLNAKSKLDSLDIQVVSQSSIFDDMASTLKNKHRSIEELNQEIFSLKSKLAILKESKTDKTQTLGAMDSIILEKKHEYNNLTTKINNLSLRVQSYERINQEIDIEIQTLSLNEDARRLFHSFREICSADNCGLFLGSAESYGKNLLYLKDQIKDLEKTTEDSKAQIKTYRGLLEQCAEDISRLLTRRESFKEANNISILLETVEGLAERVIELEYDKKLLEKLEQQNSKLYELRNSRDIAFSNAEELRSTGKTLSSVHLTTIRNDFSSKIKKWLDILRTSNVSRDVAVGTDFKIKFGNERIEQIKGSTRVRVVLAVHASIFEMILENQKSKLRFFILDTPKQQEMHEIDISDYINELKSISKKYDAQIVFSTTEYHFDCEEDDKEWTPAFDGETHKMFLGKAAV